MPFTTIPKDANNFIMKAFWNKICRIFGKKHTVMSHQPLNDSIVLDKNPVSQDSQESGLRSFFNSVAKIIIGNTETPMISGSGTKIFADDYLKDQYIAGLRSSEKTFEVRSRDGKEVYRFSK